MRQILVNDKKNYIYRFVKSNFEKSKLFNVTKFNHKINYEYEVDFLIFVFYDESDIVFFTDIYIKNNKIILMYVDILDVKMILESCKFINCINISNQKSKILTILKYIIN